MGEEKYPVDGNARAFSSRCHPESTSCMVQSPSCPSETVVKSDDWEVLSHETDADDNATDFEEDMVVLVDTPSLIRERTRSLPDIVRAADLCKDDIVVVDSEESSSSIIHVSMEEASTASSSIVMVPPLKAPQQKVMSFKDALASGGSLHASKKKATFVLPPKQKNKVRAQIVVMAVKKQSMRRCAKSTGDLLSLQSQENDDEEVLGATDSMEYYNRKAHGYNGRVNGKKLRPDEAKRREMILTKKNRQRSHGR